MNIVLLRVGIDTGAGGIHGPLLDETGTFEYIPIPDDGGIDSRKYGETRGRWGRPLADYFPESMRMRMQNKSIHFDPEFEKFTYGDPGRPKKSLRKLQPGDLLVFYCGLQGWENVRGSPALYIMGYFEVERALIARENTDRGDVTEFSSNFHVLHPEIFQDQRKQGLVLVKGKNTGNHQSRLLNRARLISEMGEDSAGKPLKILSQEMRKIFGTFGGKNSIQRSLPRWVHPNFVKTAAEFVRSLD